MKSIVSFLMSATVSALVAGSALANPAAAPAAAKPDLAKGEAAFAMCAACHAADGNSTTPVNPKLSQQHPEYLIKQLSEFKSGKRANAVMSGMVAALSDDDMRNISYWLASKPAKPGFAKDKDTVRSLLAPAATRPTALACLPNTPACRVSTPTTPPPSWSLSVTAFARTASR